MKVRSDFVSNSSSASFVIDKKEHGAWMFQAMNIVHRLSDDVVDRVQLAFDSKVDLNSLLYGLSLVKDSKVTDMVNPSFGVSAVRSRNTEDGELRYYICTSMPSLLKGLDPKCIDHLQNLYVLFEDDSDANVGHSVQDWTYKQLKATGFEFEWSR